MSFWGKLAEFLKKTEFFVLSFSQNAQKISLVYNAFSVASETSEATVGCCYESNGQVGKLKLVTIPVCTQTVTTSGR